MKFIDSASELTDQEKIDSGKEINKLIKDIRCNWWPNTIKQNNDFKYNYKKRIMENFCWLWW